MAEREGFEPPELSLNGFQDRRLKPLGHLSGVIPMNAWRPLAFARSDKGRDLFAPLVLLRPSSLVPRYSFRSPHVRPQHFRDDHAPVFLLEILQDGHHGPADREARAVQGMHKPRFFTALRFVADIAAPRLEILKVGAG